MISIETMMVMKNLSLPEKYNIRKIWETEGLGKRILLSLIVLVLGAGISYLIKDARLAVIFSILWFDTLVLGYVGFLWDVGLELTVFAQILTGFAYGPMFAAIYTGISNTLMLGLQWTITRSREPDWPPYTPGLDTIVAMLTSVMAHYLRNFPIVSAIVLASIANFILSIIVDRIILYDKPTAWPRSLNIFLNYALASTFANQLIFFVVS